MVGWRFNWFTSCYTYCIGTCIGFVLKMKHNNIKTKPPSWSLRQQLVRFMLMLAGLPPQVMWPSWLSGSPLVFNVSLTGSVITENVLGPIILQERSRSVKNKLNIKRSYVFERSKVTSCLHSTFNIKDSKVQTVEDWRFRTRTRWSGGSIKCGTGQIYMTSGFWIKYILSDFVRIHENYDSSSSSCSSSEGSLRLHDAPPPVLRSCPNPVVLVPSLSVWRVYHVVGVSCSYCVSAETTSSSNWSHSNWPVCIYDLCFWYSDLGRIHVSVTVYIYYYYY